MEWKRYVRLGLVPCLLASILLGGFGGDGTPALASCMPAGEAELRDHAELIVLVTVETVVVGPTFSIPTVRVERVFKGSSGPILALRTNSGSQFGTSVDVRFQAGVRYLIYLTRQGAEWTTTVCDGTRELPGDLPAELVPVLGPGSPPTIPVVQVPRDEVPASISRGTGVRASRR